jgi:hypothetical protein
VNLGWIWTDNLRPLLVELGLLVGYRFDDSDWGAVDYGVQGTDSEAGPWFDYPVGRLSVAMALEPGADEIVSVTVTGAAESDQERLRWLADVMRSWHLRAAGHS